MLKDCRKRCFEFTGSVNRFGVNITGIPIEDEIEDLYDEADAFNQLDITENIKIPEEKPDVEQVNSANLAVCLERAWLTPSEDKILIKGFIWQKIEYTACNKEQSVHTVESKFPFSHFIDIEDIDGDFGIPERVQNNLEDYIVLAPEDAFIEKENGRKLFKNVIVTAFFFDPSDEC